MDAEESCTAVYLPTFLRGQLEEWLDKQHNYKLVPPNSVLDERPQRRASQQRSEAESPRFMRPCSRRQTPEPVRHPSRPKSAKPEWQLPGHRITRNENIAAERPASVTSSRRSNDVHDRLYRLAHDAAVRKEEKTRRAQAERQRQEDQELKRSRALEKLSVLCEGKRGMTPQQRAAELARLESEKPARIEKSEEAVMVTRLSHRATTPSSARQPKEGQFHPKTLDSRLSHLTPVELSEHFVALHQDHNRRARRNEELEARIAHQRKVHLVEERLKNDFIFQRRVKADPSVKDRYMATLQYM